MKIGLRIAAWALGFRLISAALALLINLSFPLHAPEQLTVFGSTSPFWDTFARYDTGYFEGIAWGGYQSPIVNGEYGRSNIAYFPVYPMLIRMVGNLFERHHAIFYLAGIGISWTCYILAMVALYRLARIDLDEAQSARATVLISVFPFSFFYGVGYSESTFLLFTVLAFLGFRTRRWWLGGACAAVAIATRVPGIFMLPALAWTAWTSAQPDSRDRLRAAAGLALATVGFTAYCVFIYRMTGNPFEWAATLQRWNYHVGGAPWTAPVTLLRQLLTHPYAYLTTDRMAVIDTLYGLSGIAFLAAIPSVWRRFGGGYALFMLLNLLLPLSSGTFEGVGRYCSVLFPCFIWLASVRSHPAFTSIVVVFAMFYTLGLALFTTIHPLF